MNQTRRSKQSEPYRIWAPYAVEAQVLIGAPEAPSTFPMTKHGDWFFSDVPQVPGDRYAFQLKAIEGFGAKHNAEGVVISDPDQLDWTVPLPDPRSKSQPDGPHGFSEVVDLQTEHQWRDFDWRGRILPGGVIYELHVGTFSDSGDFAGVEKQLAYLSNLGVTHIELMPVQPFGGNRNWGYDGVSWHAVHEGYGGATGLQQLVDACHSHGLAVILDVVYNHFGPDGNYVGFFGPYTSQGATDWGDVVNLVGDRSDEVRAYILDAVRQWLVDYHIDGLRLDAVHALHDDGAFHILEQMQVIADTVSAETGVPRTLIAESDQNDPRLTRPRAAGGHGLAAQWCDDVHHAIHTLVSGEDHSYFSDFGTVEVLAKTLKEAFYHAGSYSSFRGRHHGRPLDLSVQPLSSFVTYTTTHDQTGNRAQGDRPSMYLSPAQQVLKAAVVACSPLTPMLFQGEEWGASNPFAFFCSHEDATLQKLTREGRLREFSAAGWNPTEVADPSDPATFKRSKLNWDEVSEGEHAEILSAYKSLLQLRQDFPVLRNPWSASVGTETGAAEENWLVVTRTEAQCEAVGGTEKKGNCVALAANFSESPVEIPVEKLHVAESAEVLATYTSASAELTGQAIKLPPYGFAVIG